MTDRIYDPTFGTSDDSNPIGVRCTSTEVSFPKMISVYGKKYKIIRTNVFDAKLLSKAPVESEYIVNNTDYS